MQLSYVDAVNKKTQLLDAGIPSMYGIFTCIYHENQL